MIWEGSKSSDPIEKSAVFWFVWRGIHAASTSPAICVLKRAEARAPGILKS